MVPDGEEGLPQPADFSPSLPPQERTKAPTYSMFSDHLLQSSLLIDEETEA